MWGRAARDVAGYMFGQSAVLFMPVDGVLVEGVVLDWVVPVDVVPVDVLPFDEPPVAAFAMAAPPPTRAPTMPRVARIMRGWRCMRFSPPSLDDGWVFAIHRRRPCCACRRVGARNRATRRSHRHELVLAPIGNAVPERTEEAASTDHDARWRTPGRRLGIGHDLRCHRLVRIAGRGRRRLTAGAA
jgi:hypothetical protein